MNSLYNVVGLSKQAVFNHLRRETELQEKMLRLLPEADKLRAAHPGCGVETMYDLLLPTWVGRDRFVAYMMDLGYKVQHRRKYHRTTYAVRVDYVNLIEGLVLDNIDQVWQSDITYYRIGDRHFYLNFILDVYSRRILGYHTSDSLRASANLASLRMAFGNRAKDLSGLIHHSDRGSQYTDHRYIQMLKSRNIRISMCQSAQENAYVERLHGVIKNEYLLYREIGSLTQLKTEFRKTVNHYNYHRPIKVLGKRSPVDFENSTDVGQYKLRIFSK